MTRKILKIKFTDFWPDFDEINNYFQMFLGQKYEIQLSEQPDLLIYSVFGHRHRRYNCLKVFYTGENVRPNFNECDFAFSFDHLSHPRHYRLPLYALTLKDPNRLVKGALDYEKILAEKTKFCNFIYSNPRAQFRNNFYRKLSKYKKVDSGGRHLNNIGRLVDDKVSFIRDYKFTIAFENSAYPGYTTEKLVHPMLVHSLPIYWGNKLVDRDFNPKSFLNYADFKNEDELIERIIEIDNDDNLYMEYLKQPYYHDNQVNEFIKPENVMKQFDYIISRIR